MLLCLSSFACSSVCTRSSSCKVSTLYSVGLERGSEGGGVGGVATDEGVSQIATLLSPRAVSLLAGSDFTGDCEHKIVNHVWAHQRPQVTQKFILLIY